MAFGVDYSYDPPTVAQMTATGVRFVLRYVSTPGHLKNITAAERSRLQAAGLDIGIVCQVRPDDALAGHDRGVERARSAQEQVRAVGGPDGSVIYLSVDFDAEAAQLPACRDYLDGAAAVLGRSRVGVYGGYRTIEYLAAAGAATYYWQTAAWSAGRWSAAAHLQQYRANVALGSGTVDYDRSTAEDFGQWGAQEWWGAPLAEPDLAALRTAFREAW